MIWLLGGYMWLYVHRPFEVWPWLGDLHIERVYMLVTILYWVLAAEKRWIPNRLNAAFIFFWIVLLASWLLSPYSAQGRDTVEAYFQIAVFYVLVMSTVHNERDLKRLVIMYVLAAGLYMAHSLREYACGGGAWDSGTYRLWGVDKTHNDANSFAATAVYSLTMALPLWHECRTRWHRWAIIAYVALGVTCVLLSGSRMGFSGLCCLVAIVALFSKHRFKVAVVLVLAAPVIWNCLPTDRQNRFLTLWDPAYGPPGAKASADSRWQGWHDGVRIWKEHLLLGAGPNAFAPARGGRMQAHNLYGQVLGELGTLGAVAFGMVVLGFFANYLDLRRICRHDPDSCGSFLARLIQSVTLAVILALLMGFGGHNLYRYTWLWFGAFQAIALKFLLSQSKELVKEMVPHAVDAREAPIGEYGVV
jgi:O-antigen ligase